jgi:DNA-binding NarL/FixJ family response regulator
MIGLVPGVSLDDLIQGVAAGVRACLLEDSSLSELLKAIDTIAQGGTYCSDEIMLSLFEQLARLAKGNPAGDHADMGDRADTSGLTRREDEILHFMSTGLSNKEIARKLSVSVYTVKNHVHNILEKLEVDNRFAAVEYARERSWLSS